MYTAVKSDVARLRAYRDELTTLYADALRHRDAARARQLADRRRQVQRAILLHEEWHVETEGRQRRQRITNG